MPLATLPRVVVVGQCTVIPTSLHPAAKLGGCKQHHSYKTKAQKSAHPQHKVSPILLLCLKPGRGTAWSCPAKAFLAQAVSPFKPSSTRCPGQAGTGTSFWKATEGHRSPLATKHGPIYWTLEAWLSEGWKAVYKWLLMIYVLTFFSF